uniref:enoyl-CoA hydratase n=1 Tax=Syphacia muris TaxID=451379 RepID=A0A0N5AZH2_9BILA
MIKAEDTDNNFKYLNNGYRHLTVQVYGNDIAVISLNGPDKENVLNEEIAEELHQVMDALNVDKRIIGVVIASAKVASFVAGADIRMLEKTNSSKAVQLSRYCQDEFKNIEGFRCPVVAAIMGNCMGGGLELILSCSYRICLDTDTTVFSVPEVKLGLLPAGGGTQRLPKKIFLPKALDMLMTGRTITAKTAYDIGLVEKILDPVQNENGEVNYEESLKFLRTIAIITARRIALKTLSVKNWYSTWINVQNYFASTWLVWNYVIKTAIMREVEKIGVQNMPAPHSIIKSVEAALFGKSEIGYKVESEEFGYLIETKESKALIGLFHGITKCKKQRFGKPANIRSICVIGTSDAALACACKVATKEFVTTVVVDSDCARQTALDYVENYFDYLNKKQKKYDPSAPKKEHINVSIDDASISSADFILIALELNAVDEAYKRTLEHVEELANEKATILIHLFGRSLNSIVKIAKHPSRILGVCYGLPYKSTKYAEIVKHDSTDSQAIANAAFILWRQKTYILLTTDNEKTPGYYLVHCVLSILQTTSEGLLNGSIRSAQDMDNLTKRAGFIGKIASLCDLIGLDAIYKICDRYNVNGIITKLLEELVLNGRTGSKHKKGFYLYDDYGHKVNDDPVFKYCVSKAQQTILKKFSQVPNVSVTFITIRTPTSTEWDVEPAAKLVVNIVNTALRCYENGIITEPEDGDVGCVFGVGFPPAYGGPFRYISQRKEDIIPIASGNKQLCLLFQKQLNEAKKFY